MEVIVLREDDRVVASLHQQQQPSLQSSSLIHVPVAAVGTVLAVGDRGIERVVVVDREGGGGGVGDRNAERGFMISARTHALVQQSTTSLRTLSSKRKLEEFEIGMAESAISAASQVRVRRESWEEVQEGRNIAESSGRERYEGYIIGTTGEAQALEGENQMRDEGGNFAIDDDSAWEEEPFRNASSKGLLELIDENGRGDDGNMVEGSDDNSTDLQLVFIGSRVVDSGSSAYAGLGGSSGNLSGFTSGLSNGIGGDENESLQTETGQIDPESTVGGADDIAGRELEIGKETELDGFWGREVERDGLTVAYEESFSGVYGCVNSGMSVLGESSVSSSQNTLSTNVSSAFGGVSSRNNIDGVCRNPAQPSTSMEAQPTQLQFFVRTYMDGRTIVLHAHGSDLVESVYQQIFLRTGLPVSEQRLIFGRLQLQQDQTLEDCKVVDDSTLYLVARMRSTALPASWQLINDLVATIRQICGVDQGQVGLKLMHFQDCIRASVQDFLKMASKSVPVSEHMQVFELAGATLALVMLLLSPVESNRECAEDSISLFLSSNDEYLPPHIHCHCAPLLLDFCKLLAKSAPNHNLYPLCRNALARLLDTVGVAHGSPYFNEAKAESIVHDFAPFVTELSLRLTANLRRTASEYAATDAPINFSSYVKEAKDFTAFVIPLCKAMEVCKGIEGSGLACSTGWVAAPKLPPMCRHDFDVLGDSEEPLSGEVSCKLQSESNIIGNIAAAVGAEIGSHGWLRQLFKDLLQEIGNCLEAVGHVAERQAEQQKEGKCISPSEERPFALAPFLVVLKGLHAVAKLYEGAMTDLLEMLHMRQSSLNVLIRQSQWQDDDLWLLDHKILLDFESKRRLVMAMLPEPQDDHDERQEIVVHRGQLLTDSFELLAYVEPEVLQGGISVEFATEEATGPGVLREWFSMICREIFNPQNALFLACPNDRRRFFPNPASGVNPGHLTYFRFCGRVIALALMHRVQVDVVFALTFFKQLAGLPVLWEDAKDADPSLYESCKKILEMEPDVVDTDSLGLTFVSEVEELGTHKIMELCMGGKDMPVSSKNRRVFVELFVQRRLVASVAEQVKSFSQGLSDLLVNATHQQFLQALEPEDLDLMLYGKDRNVSLDDWKAHTEYHDYSVTDEQIIWFWEVAEKMSAEQQRRLLFFSTSLMHLPAEGFAGLSSKFHIHKAHTDISWLPTAHTCFYQLVLPPYPTYQIMHARLHAITECHIAEGFGFS